MRGAAAKALRFATFGKGGSHRVREYDTLMHTVAKKKILVRCDTIIATGKRRLYQHGKNQWRASTHAQRAAFRRMASVNRWP